MLTKGEQAADRTTPIASGMNIRPVFEAEKPFPIWYTIGYARKKLGTNVRFLYVSGETGQEYLRIKEPIKN